MAYLNASVDAVYTDDGKRNIGATSCNQGFPSSVTVMMETEYVRL
jgi:hypothetical protein